VNKKKVYSISINCEPNDPVDVRCGGPLTLGFDFVTRSDETPEELEKHLRFILKENHIPCLSISICEAGAWAKCKMWTKKQMEECIKEGY